MSKWKLRGCPRCSGDMYLEKDYDDYYERCLQCGYIHNIENLNGMDAYYQSEQKIDRVKIPIG